jgi:hypothetical protein
VQHFGEHVIAERGVRHGKLVRMPVETPAASSGSRHRSHHHHDHDQVAPKPPPSGSLSPGNAFQKQGFVRIGSENVVGPMPPYGEIIGTEDDIWKIIAWIRSKHCEQDPARC